MRSITRVTGVHIDTVTKLLIAAGEACLEYHDEHVRGLSTERMQVDEIWSFIYAKEKNVPYLSRKAPPEAGSTWTWTALDADSKLLVSWLVGARSDDAAHWLVQDMADRVTGRFQLTSDGLSLYRTAVESVFGADVDFAQLIKQYGPGPEPEAERRYSPSTCHGTRTERIMGDPDPSHISTSYVERSNLTFRMQNRRYTRLTNGFSKRIANHAHQVALFVTHYNWCRIHQTLRVTPAMSAGLTDTLRDINFIVDLVEARDPQPGPRGPYRRRRIRRADADRRRGQ